MPVPTSSDQPGGAPPGAAARVWSRRRFLAVSGLGLASVAAASCATGPTVRTFGVSFAVRGSVWADVEGFANHAIGTLNTYQGWSLGGSARFVRVPSGGDFTLWMCEAGQVPSFSSGCSAAYSCRVGRDVVINQDRWQYGTQSWPYGLDEYRHYVVNHEVGHWFGLDHLPSPGPGRLCPVMFQQTIGITDGSIYNTWPLRYEKDMVSARWGLPIYGN